MIRVCDVRRRRRPPSGSAAGDPGLQCRVIDLVLRTHPFPQTFPALAAALLPDRCELLETIALACAVRDLALAGLLSSDGLHVLPTRAALYFWRLEEGR